MKKWGHVTLALLGIQMGLIASPGSENLEGMTPEMRAFYGYLNTEGKRQFLELDEQHREAALSAIHIACSAANLCRGIREEAVRAQHEDQRLQEWRREKMK